MSTQVWWEDSERQHDYDLSDFRLLIIIAEEKEVLEGHIALPAVRMLI